MLRRRLTTGLAAAGLSGAMATAATAQDPSVTPTPIETATPTPSTAPSITPSPSPTETPTGTPESLGTFTVDLPADTPTPRPTVTADPRRNRAAAKRIARQTGAVPKVTPSPTATPTADSTAAPGDVAMPNWDQLPAAQVSAASLHAFRIPPFLLPIYQAAGVQYGVRWEVLAAINEVETDYGRNLDVSSAGALGWMQFMPASWKAWGVDANGDGVKDPFNPVDAIFAAARYLRAAGAGTNLRRAIFAYNHADWYVDDVLRRAQAVAALPTPLVGALTGLAQGRFPVAGAARYPAVRHSLNGLRLITHPGAAVVATTDGRVQDFGSDARRGRYIVLADAYGNRYTYAHLGRVAATYPVVRSRPAHAARAPRVDPEPVSPASKTDRGARPLDPPAPSKERLFANPPRSTRPLPGATLELNRRDFTAQSMHRGARVMAGTILGRSTRDLLFEIRPAGQGAPRIDPKPILDGWRLLQSTALYHHTDGAASLGQVLLMGKSELQRQVLTDPGVSIYPCGRRDIRLGLIDRRVLATLEFLAASNLEPTVSALECGHSYLTTSGNVSEHSSGSAVDIAAINGTPILGHQGPGSITETTINRLLTLQGPLQPHQIISLMPYDDSPTAFALPDHADHIHVGFHPEATWAGGLNGSPSLSGGQWPALVKRIGEIQLPTVRTTPSRYSLRVRSD